MARRRNPFAGRPNPRNMHMPPPPVAVAAPVIDLAGLRNAYAWMALNKIAGFRLVLEWYENSQTALIYKDPLDAAKQKDLETVRKLTTHANGTNLEPEKIAFWEKAIRVMERIWSHKLPDWPTLDKAAQTSHVPEMIQHVQTVLGNLNAAFAGAGVTFRVTFESDRQFLHGEILLPQAEAVAMIPQTPLQVALKEVPTVAKVLAIVPDGNGGQQLDGALFMQKLPLVLAQVGAWSAGADKINKPVGKAPQAPKGRAPGAKRAAAGANGPVVKLRDSDVITVVAVTNKAFKGGKRGAVWSMLRNGLTVGQLRTEAQAKINDGGYALQVLKVMVAKGLVKIN